MKWRVITTWPKALVVHIVGWLGDVTKNNAAVKFAFEEKMGTVAYKLTAVIEHRGKSPNSGH